MTKTTFTLFIFLFYSCINLRSPTQTPEFAGGVMTCISDSTAITREKVVKIKQQIQIDKKCMNCKYSACDNKPEYFDFIIHWPSFIGLDFKKKTFVIITNPEPYHPEIKYGEPGFEVHYDVDGGELLFNKKKKEIMLQSDHYDWKRVFNYEFSKTDSVLTLISKDLN